MQFLPEEIDQYSANHTAAHSELLNLIEQETWQEVLMPRMLSGCLLYTSPSPRDVEESRMPSSA